MRLADIDLISAVYVCRELRAADVRELEATRWAALNPDELAVQIVQQWAPAGYAWSVFGDDGKPAAVFGATQPWPNMFSAWMLATDAFPAVGLPLTKFVKSVFIPHLIERGALRVEARSIDGHDRAHRWLRLLGATVESRMAGYGRAGEDFLVFTLPLARDADSVDNGDCLST